MTALKILAIFIVIGLVQITLCKCSKDTPREQRVSPKEQLLQYYDDEMQKNSKDFCEKVKKLSQDLIKDPKIEQPETPVFLKFKQNISEFLQTYDTYSRYKLYNTLVLRYADITLHYYSKSTDPNRVYIRNLFKTLGYDAINEEYDRQNNEVFVKKLMEKYEEHQEVLGKDPHLMEWYGKMKSCKDYTCYYEANVKLADTMNSPKEQLYDTITHSLVDLYIYYGERAKHIGYDMLKYGAFDRVIIPEAQEFKRNITQFIEKYNTNQDVDELQNIIYFYYNFTSKYYQQNTNSHLIAHVLTRFNSHKLDLEYRQKFNEFVVNKFSKDFEKFKSQLSAEGLRKEKVFVDWFDHLKTLKTFEQRVQAFDVLKTLPTGCQLKIKLLYKCKLE